MKISIPVRWRILALPLLLAAASVGFSQLAHAQNKIVRIAMPSEPGTIDPHSSVGGAYEIMQAIFDGLVKLDHDLNLVPRLAESWKQVDDKTVRFKLREGVKFHSGNPFDAEAVKAWFDAMLDPADPGVSAGKLKPVSKVVVVDKYTVEIQLKEAFGPFVRSLSIPHLVIYDVAERKRLGPKGFASKPSGTGAFRFKEWRRGQAIVLEANPDYREKGKPKVDILEFSFMPEPSGRIAALEVGQIDIAYALPGHQVPRMEAMPDVTPLKKRALRPIVWFFNMRHPILSDPAVRRALVHAVDMDLIGETILEHGGKVLQGYITQGAYGGLEMPFGYKPEYSALLLAQAGWTKNSDGIYEKNGKKLTLTAQIGVDRYPDILAVGEAIQAQLRDQGWDFHIRGIEQSSLEAGVQSARKTPHDGDVPPYDMVTWGHGMRDGQAYGPLTTAWSNAFGYTGSVGHWSNQNFDQLMAIAVKPLPEQLQLQAYHDAQRVMYAEVPGLPLYSPLWVRGIRSGIEGYRLHSAEQEYWEDLELNR